MACCSLEALGGIKSLVKLIGGQAADVPENWTSKLAGRALDYLHTSTRFLNSRCMNDIRISQYAVWSNEAKPAGLE